MNVYTIKAYGNYGGGMALVAAPDKAVALAVACQIIDKSWLVRYGEPDSVELMPCICDGPSRVLDHYETGE